MTVEKTVSSKGPGTRITHLRACSDPRGWLIYRARSFSSWDAHSTPGTILLGFCFVFVYLFFYVGETCNAAEGRSYISYCQSA